MTNSSNPIVENRRLDREAPGPHFVRAAAIWSAILGHNIRADQVVQCMIGLKLAREAGRHEPDNHKDIEGYASLIPEVLAYITPQATELPKEYAEDRFPDRPKPKKTTRKRR